MGQDTVRLYTRQNDKTLLPLKRQGRIINQRIYVEMHFGDIAPLFLESYDWFTKEAARRVPKPEDVKAPIWCSISAENCLKPIDGTVVYVLEVPKEKVIYFDEAKWDYVLNRIYLPKDEQDAASYREHLKLLGISNGFEFFEGRYKGMYPEEERRIVESWKRVFEIDNWTIFNVCGNIWEITEAYVQKIVYPGEDLEGLKY
ncbi:DUF3841 domain-containing protein [[Clostridium] hylemonae]|uniref:DUF3841 domain-containing protein n=1 Tax=[Clostridium] hylemonae TaxID=89153 RepID=UPI001D077874|nr:DUF3841 domain-containing protein [[Clostridium] hylemonae]MCB7520880.1 DUF3841 domain-containing protein [[Clostridium] hylemonae]